MVDPKLVVISCEHPEKVIAAIDAVMPSLDRDVGRQLTRIILLYWQLYGFDGLYKRVNGRTVADILKEYDSTGEPPPIASGQVGDIRYELYDAEARATPNSDQGTGE